MNKMALIYIVEDDENIREIETIALKNSNYMVCAFEKAKDFYRKLEDIMPDLVLLDVMLPDESGYDIVRKLRKDPTTRQLPIIMVTAKTAEMDMIKGLDEGADDYIKKPFSIMELITRVKALLRRTITEDIKYLQVDNLVLDHERHMVFVDNKQVELTFKEYELLRLLGHGVRGRVTNGGYAYKDAAPEAGRGRKQDKNRAKCRIRDRESVTTQV